MERFGLSEEEAIEKIKKIKNVNTISVNWQMERFGLSEEEAIKKIESIKRKSKISINNMSDYDFNSMIPSKKEHWMKKGLSEEESVNKVNEMIKIATNNCNNFSKKIKGDKSYNKIRTTNIEYYLNKGYNLEESKQMLSKRQSTFSLEKCISKLGFDEGYKRWLIRQSRWLKSLEGKIDNSKKDSTSFNFFLIKNNGDYDLSLVDYKNRLERRLESKFGRASIESLKIFKHLIKLCEDCSLKYYCGIENNREYYLINSDNKVYAYDFTIPEINLIFEYHGSFWHSKNDDDKMNGLGYNLNESYHKDIIKKELAIKNGFHLFEVYSEDGFDYNLNRVISLFNELINTN